MDDRTRHAFLAIFLAALVVSSLFQGSRGLYDRDETRYSECAREMLVTGSWLVPLRDFRPHLTKPPLTYWAIASGLMVFGTNEWGARLPNALAFSITVLLTGLIGARLVGPACGLAASTIYMCSLVPFAASNIVTTDTILVMWETAAVWAFVAGMTAGTRSGARWWFRLMAVFWGLGFLTKGPAIIPVATPLALFWALRRDRFKAFPAGPLVIALFVLVGLSWYVTVCLKYPWALELIIREQVTGRLFSDIYHRNSAWYAPVYIYLPLILFGLLPWSASVFGHLAVKVRGASFRDLFQGVSSALRDDDPLLFLCLWWLVPLVVFTLARSRLPLYILPVFVPMALAAGRYMARAGKEGAGRGPGGLPAGMSMAKTAFFLAALVAIKGLAVLVPAPQDARAMYTALAPALKGAKELAVFSDRDLEGLSFYMQTRRPLRRIHCKAAGDRAAGAPSQGTGTRRHPRGGRDAAPGYVLVDMNRRGWRSALEECGLDEPEVMARYRNYALVRAHRAPL